MSTVTPRFGRALAIAGAIVTTVALTAVPQAASASALSAAGPCTRTITGPIVGAQEVPAGEFLCLRSATVQGAINVAAGGALRIVRDSTVFGAVTSTGATSLWICESRIAGAITATNGVPSLSGPAGITIGDSATCGTNLVEGALTLTDNTGFLRLTGNTVAGAVTVNGNVTGTKWGVRISGNVMGDALSCAGNLPAPINQDSPNTVAGVRSGQCSAQNF